MSSVGISDLEYGAVTEACGLLDRSERGKLALTGGQAKGFLQGQVSNDVEALSAGAGCYATFLTPKGKMLGDLRILDTGEELLIDTERVALQELFNMIRRFSIGYEVQLHKRTLERGLLSLLGPEADAVCGLEPGAEEHAHTAGEVGGIATRAIRTDLGLDLLCDAGDTGSRSRSEPRKVTRAVASAVHRTVSRFRWNRTTTAPAVGRKIRRVRRYSRRKAIGCRLSRLSSKL